jgi:glycosyltransferase involved in cell wall biosynthesis
MNSGTDKNNHSIALIGLYPPPYGGVSIHIQRLAQLLESRQIKYTIYDISGVSKKDPSIVVIRNVTIWLLYHSLYLREGIIHCHGYSPKTISILSLLGIIKRKVIMVTLHSFRYEQKNMSLLDRFAFWMARKAQVNFIAVGQEIKNKIIPLGLRTENVKVIPAFIPPTVRQAEIDEIPQDTWAFIHSHRPVISANAFSLRFYNNQDLYGLDMCVELCATLKSSYPDIGIIFALPDIGDNEYFQKIKQRIAEKGINGNFFFQTKPCQFYPILMKSDVFVRPTNTDGDAVSIREALYFKVPLVTSDVVARPEGSILFKPRDFDDFISKVKDVLDNSELYKKRLETLTTRNSVERIMELYQELAEGLK